MEFPHLSDTNFPILENVNVYSYRNTFDYTRWVPNTHVKLTNVLWNSDYNDVVKFENDAARDRWFDDVEDSYEITLLANHTVPPEGGIKLPIPYDVAVRYNYLVVDIPIMTSENEQIMYEDSETGVRRWYFFVDEVSSRAPNTTMFILSLDVWTQFHNDVEINYMFLERGHAPVAATDTDEYLENPIQNNEYLLTPDVTPTGASVIRDSDFIPFGGGTKYVCILSTLAPEYFNTIGTVTHNSADYTYIPDLSYTNNPDVRHGYQLNIEHIGIGNGDDYSTLYRLNSSEISSKATNGKTPANVEVYAIRADYVYQGGHFFSDIALNAPHFMNTVLGCFIADESMIEFNNSYHNLTISGYEVKVVYGKRNDIDIPSLVKTQFGFPQQYQRFAKLYTFPYSCLELTDNNGETVTVRIENTGDIKAHQLTNISMSCLRTRVFFTGIDGIGSEQYSWKYLNNTTVTQEISNSDWFRYCFDHEIPCYAIYMDSDTAWYLENFNSKIRGKARDVIAAYHQAMRINNTQYENDKDYDDTIETNANNNSLALLDNTYEDTNALSKNTANTILAMNGNTSAAIAANTAKTEFAATTSNTINQLNYNKLWDVNNAANANTFAVVQANNEAFAATTKNNNTAAINGAVGTAAASGSVFGLLSASAAAGSLAGTALAPGVGTALGALGGLAVGGTVGLISTFASAGAADSNASVTITTNETIKQATATNNNAGTLAATHCNTQTTVAQNSERTYNTGKDNDLLNTNNNRSVENLRSNNNNTIAAMNLNALRTRNAADINAANLRSVNDSNSNYMNHNSKVFNAKEQAEKDRYASQYQLWQAGLEPARQIGNFAGDNMQELMGITGIQIRVRTMSDSEVRQVGDWFARYGYALDQIWDVSNSGLCPMKHFCYWKCRDIWVDDKKASNNNALRVISNIFERGVTVWKNPNDIGRVSVYAN